MVLEARGRLPAHRPDEGHPARQPLKQGCTERGGTEAGGGNRTLVISLEGEGSVHRCPLMSHGCWDRSLTRAATRGRQIPLAATVLQPRVRAVSSESGGAKEIAEYLYAEREWTMGRIAKALDVSRQTIGSDLGNLPRLGNLRSGPGRPRSPVRSLIGRKRAEQPLTAHLGATRLAFLSSYREMFAMNARHALRIAVLFALLLGVVAARHRLRPRLPNGRNAGRPPERRTRDRARGSSASTSSHAVRARHSLAISSRRLPSPGRPRR